MSRPDSMAALLIEAIRARIESLPAARAADGDLLRGLEGLVVLDVRVSPALTGESIEPGRMRDVLVQELGAAQIPLPKPRDGSVLGGLVASLNGLEATDGSWAVYVTLELKQRARLCRDPSAVFDATTWLADAAAVSVPADLDRTCRRLFAEVVGRLAAALRQAGS
jgi:hypothetical protein